MDSAKRKLSYLATLTNFMRWLAIDTNPNHMCGRMVETVSQVNQGLIPKMVYELCQGHY